MSDIQKPRIVIYGTGQFGGYVTRIALEKQWEIVAAFNRAGPKVGQDLGVLAGLGREIGVIVRDCDKASFDDLGSKADVGIVTMSDRLRQNFPAYERLIDAGLNVLCLGAESGFPYGVDRELADEIDAMAKKRNKTFCGGGVWDMSRISAGIMVAGPCTEITSLHHTSLTDAQNSGLELMVITGVGMTVQEHTEKIVNAPGKIGGFYKTIPWHVLHALGYTVTRATERRQPLVFEEPYYCRLLNEELAPGVVVGTRILVEVETKEGVFADALLDARCLKAGETQHTAWTVKGKPETSIRVDRTDTGYMTAASIVNRVRDVIAAPPGIVTTSQMGLMRPTLWERR